MYIRKFSLVIQQNNNSEQASTDTYPNNCNLDV